MERDKTHTHTHADRDIEGMNAAQKERKRH